MAETNGYPTSTITKLNAQIQNKLQQSNTNIELSNKKWVTFTFHSPIICRITNIFRDTNLKIALQNNNSIHNILSTQCRDNNIYKQSGIYRMIFHTCHNSYIGQTGGKIRNHVQRTYKIY